MSGVPALPAPHRVHVIVNAEGGTVRAESWSAPYRKPHRLIGYDAHSIEFITLGQRDRLDSGRLWLFLAKQRTRVELMGFALCAAIGRFDGLRNFEQFDNLTLEIDMRASRDQVATDGEVTVKQSPLHHRSRPRALQIFAAPKPAASAG